MSGLAKLKTRTAEGGPAGAEDQSAQRREDEENHSALVCEQTAWGGNPVFEQEEWKCSALQTKLEIYMS